jgi:hypothetical protein
VRGFRLLLPAGDGPAGPLDALFVTCQIGATRVGGIDTNKARIRAALAAALGLAVAPDGFTTAQFTAQVQSMTGQTEADYSIRQGRLRGKGLVAKPGSSRRYQVPEDAARTIAALLAVRDKVIAPILAGVAPLRGRPPTTLTQIDRDHEALRADMHTCSATSSSAPKLRWRHRRSLVDRPSSSG